jgi:hypothetical protein
MRNWRWKLIALVGIISLLWVGIYYGNRRIVLTGAARVLEEAEQYELYSLLPQEESKRGRPNFQGYPVRGRCSVTDPAIRKRLTDVLRAGSRWGSAMSCFEPRHGIRVKKGQQETDFVICFECNLVQICTNGRRSGAFVIDSSAQRVFDDVLQRAGIPMAPDALEKK